MDKAGLREYVRSLTPRPGVYRMVDAQGRIIYVGKAKNLKKRVGSYFGRSHDAAKTRTLVEHTAGVEVTVTDTEADALLLESNLGGTAIGTILILVPAVAIGGASGR